MDHLLLKDAISLVTVEHTLDQPHLFCCYSVLRDRCFCSFKKHRKSGPIAQFRLERTPDKREVGGSTPPGPTIKQFNMFAAMVRIPRFWGCSSVGRAPALHAGGHRFDPVHLHHPNLCLGGRKTLDADLRFYIQAV